MTENEFVLTVKNFLADIVEEHDEEELDDTVHYLMGILQKKGLTLTPSEVSYETY